MIEPDIEMTAVAAAASPALAQVSALRQAVHTVGVRSLTLVCRFALVVVITRALSAADYGAYSLVTTIASFGVFVCGLNLSTFVYRVVPGQPKARQLRILKTTFLFEVTLTVAVVLLFLVSGQLPAVLRYLNADGYRTTFMLGLVLMVLLVANAELTNFFQAQTRLERSNWVDFLGQAAWILPLLAVRAGGVQITLVGLLVMQLSGGFGAVAYAVRHIGLRAWRRARADWSVLPRALAFSVPLIVPTMGVSSVRFADRLILSHYRSVADVGVYAFAAVFINTLYSFTAGIISTTFGPRIFAAHNRGDYAQRDVLQTYMLKTAVVCFAVPYIALCLGARPLISLLARPDYLRAVGVLPLVGLSSLVLIVGYPANFMLTLQNRVVLLAGIDVVGMLVGLTANFVLIPRYSYFGAAAAGALGLTITAALQYVCSRTWMHIRLDLIFSAHEEISVLRRCVQLVREVIA